MELIAEKNSRCRICRNRELAVVIDFGNLALTGVFHKNGSSVPQAPVLLARCTDCGLVQLGHNYSLEHLYNESYGYESHLNSSMVSHLQQKARLLEDKYLKSLKEGIIVDIASNDGTLLSGYKNKNLVKVGIDPLMEIMSSYYPQNSIKIKKFFSASEYWKNCTTGANLVTSLSVLYDIEDPINFARQINEILIDNGIWHFEQSYLPMMLQSNSYDTICHEHLLYLSLHDIRNILRKSGFELIDASLNNTNGGSIAVTAIKSSKKFIEAPFVQYLMNLEVSQGICNGNALLNFAQNYKSHSSALTKLIYQYLDHGFDVVGFGASTKGNVLLQASGLNSSHIRIIGEVNTRKFGKQTPGSCIPIVSEEELIDSSGDKTVALVLPWHFRETLIKSLEVFLGKGGRLLFPLPNIEEVCG